MEYRQFGKTDMKISELSFGTWAIGGAWGKTNDQEALNGLARAMEAGVNFFLIQQMFMVMVIVKSY